MNQIQEEVPKWEPPVPDDPRFIESVPPEEQLDWKSEPAFQHKDSVRLFEGVKQACLIAKAQHFEFFPSAVDKLIGAVEIKDSDVLIQRAIMQSQVWNTDETKLPKRFDPKKPRWSWKKEFGITELKSSQILLRNYMRLCQSQVTEFSSLENRKKVNDLHLYSYVMFRDKPIIMNETIDMLLTSDAKLPPFASEDIVDDSAMHKIPDMWPVFPTVDFVETNNYELNSHTGFKKEDEKLTNPHTIIQIPRKLHWNEGQYQAGQIMTCLMYTAALARRKFGDDVRLLPEPICVQHVWLEQGRLLFTFFQLNTLDLDKDTGIKNLVWTGEKGQLFEKILAQPWMPKPMKENRLENYDPSAFDKLLAVYLNGAPEVGSLEARESSTEAN